MQSITTVITFFQVSTPAMPSAPQPIVTYSTKKQHICKYCAKEFSTKWNVIRHVKLFHNPDDPVIVPQGVANGFLMQMSITAPSMKPERYQYL